LPHFDSGCCSALATRNQRPTPGLSANSFAIELFSTPEAAMTLCGQPAN
jgi:hypothetical protein